MGIITKIEDQKNKKRFNIFVDNAFFCGLMKETAILANLKVGKEINEDELNKLIFNSEVKMAFEKASSLLAIREHSKKEIVDKLLLKGYQKEVVLAAVEKLEEYHYVDDFLFAKHFVEQNSKYSRVMIEVKLRQRGVDSECIAVAFENFEQEDELIFCQKQVDKYLKGKDLNKQGTHEKLIASLIRKGFKINTIKSVLERFYFYNDDNFD